MHQQIDDSGSNEKQVRSLHHKRSTVDGEVIINSSSSDPEGELDIFRPRPDLAIIIARHTHPPPLRITFEIEQAPLSFCYNLSHRDRCTMTDGTRNRKVMERSPGDGVLAYLPLTRGVVETREGETVGGVSLHFCEHTFREMFEDLPQYLRGLGTGRLETVERRRLYHQAPFSEDTFIVLKQILDCPYRGNIRRLFLEAKSLELVSLKLFELEQNRTQKTSIPHHRDLERVREAHHILIKNLSCPPSLADLSRKVGINRNKLNYGFKKLYGETVFNVLRNARLSRAWSLLQSSELTLSEIALSVGYNNQANFTTAFRRRFGKTPKTVRMKGMEIPFPGKRITC
jgi:AraC-like DNA-binding protein